MHVLDAAGACKLHPQPRAQMCCPASLVPLLVTSSGGGSICVRAAEAVGGPMLR